MGWTWSALRGCCAEGDAIGLRDLRWCPRSRGRASAHGGAEAQGLAAGRGFRRLQLRVYEENPARALYARLGFAVESVVDGTVHMAWSVLPRGVA